MPKSKDKEFDYVIYTDGGCEKNPGGRGGCAAVVFSRATGITREFVKGFASTTNNRMEIMGLIMAFQHVSPKSKVLVYSDSQYLIKIMTGEWKPSLNRDLFDILKELVSSCDVEYKWVKGHNGNRNNERCDELCREIIKTGPFFVDHAFEADNGENTQ